MQSHTTTSTVALNGKGSNMVLMASRRRRNWVAPDFGDIRSSWEQLCASRKGCAFRLPDSGALS